MYYEYSANKTGDYLRDVVGPAAARQERLLNELARTRPTAEPAESRPRVWTRAFSATVMWMDEQWTGDATTP
jgi:hypothetical protein